MKTILKSTTALLLSMTFAGQTLAAEMLKEIGKGEGEVAIVAWAGYIERGETDKNYDWVTDFEKQTGCKVTVKTAATSDEMVTLMNQGGFDLVTASGDASLRLVAGGKVQPINIDLVKSWATLDDRLKDAPWHTVDGVHYGVPYQWGPNVLMYNTKVFGDKKPASWSVVFEEQTLPDGKSNKGRVQAYDGPIYIADAALYLKAHKPELGIKDPYELNETQYAAVLDLLKGQRSLVGRYWHDATVQVDDFKNEGVVASSSCRRQAAGRLGLPERRCDGMGRYDHDACRCRASELRLYVARTFAVAQGAGRCRRLVRLGAGRAGRLQGQCAADRHRLRHQRFRQFRQDQLLEDTGLQVQERRHLRAVSPLGVGLYCRAGRAVRDCRQLNAHPSPAISIV